MKRNVMYAYGICHSRLSPRVETSPLKWWVGAMVSIGVGELNAAGGQKAAARKSDSACWHVHEPVMLPESLGRQAPPAPTAPTPMRVMMIPILK